MSVEILQHRGKGITGAAIRWQTRSPYGHSALLFDRKYVVETHLHTGVIRRSINVDDYDADLFAIRSGYGYDKEQLWSWVEGTIGCRYDRLAVLRFVTRRNSSNNDRWFCSEHVFCAFSAGGLLLLSETECWEVSPGLLARSPILVNRGNFRTILNTELNATGGLSC